MLKNINKYGLKLFDVSLRDGVQSLPNILSLSKKKDIFHKITNKYNPDNIEVGSIVSEKRIPQLKDSKHLFNHGEIIGKKNMFLLIPNFKKYINIMTTSNNITVRNISLITSVSESFTIKNSNMSEKENLDSIELILKSNTAKPRLNQIKLYISCINECPINGKLDNDLVIEKIKTYFKFRDISEFCLSDTCGTLNFKDYKYIIDNTLKYIEPNKIGLHLHTSQKTDEVKKIINYSIRNNIKKFDVSCLENTGGCVVTINRNKINSNLTYEKLESLLE
jgi:hydroxymethylglutaryl-CoA lyase